MRVLAILSTCAFYAFLKLLFSKRNKQNQLILLSQDEEEEEGKQRSNLLNLPDDILQLILKQLPMADHIRVGSVCTQWRINVTSAITSNSCSPPGLPVLMLFSQTIRHDLDPGFFSLKDTIVYYPKRPLYGCNECCVGSVDGWLIMAHVHLLSLNAHGAITDPDSSPFFFWNPVSDARILLPSRITIPPSLRDNKYLFCAVKASSGPHCPDCIVATKFIDHGHLAYCRLADKSWTVIEVHSRIKILDIQILDGKLYVLTLRNLVLDSILVYDLRGGSLPRAKILIRLQHQLDYSFHDWFLWEENGSYHVNNSVSYILARDPTSGDLLFVLKVADVVFHAQSLTEDIVMKKFTSQPKQKDFIVYKLDMSKGDAQLVKVDNLGDRILFVTSKDSMVIPISALNGPKDLVRGNCIYFAHSYPCLGRLYSGFQVVLTFCLTEKKIKYFPFCNSTLGSRPNCMWFMPTL